MKPITSAPVLLLLILATFFLFEDLLDTYNTQRDRDLFVRTYEIVIECRKPLGVNSGAADKLCGTVPVFTDNVK